MAQTEEDREFETMTDDCVRAAEEIGMRPFQLTAAGRLEFKSMIAQGDNMKSLTPPEAVLTVIATHTPLTMAELRTVLEQFAVHCRKPESADEKMAKFVEDSVLSWMEGIVGLLIRTGSVEAVCPAE